MQRIRGRTLPWSAQLPRELEPQTAPGVWECVLGLLPGSGRVLNAGAGRGGMSLLLDQRGFQVTSIDLCPENFQAEHMPCLAADLNHPLAFGDGEFDVVLAVEVMEHLENPWGFLREALRVLREDGCLVFTTPNVSSLLSRLVFLCEGTFPYFRDESFAGCHHVTPIFPWSVERACRTERGILEKVLFSRTDWPTRRDVPRHDGGNGKRRKLLDLLPLNFLTGEIACYVVRKEMPAKLEADLPRT